jgi:hypothetical protein
MTPTTESTENDTSVGELAESENEQALTEKKDD